MKEKTLMTMWKTVRVAVLVVPGLLLVAAGSAGAVATFPTTTLSCFTVRNAPPVLGVGSFSDCGATQLSPIGNIAGVKLFTTTPLVFPGGGTTVAVGVQFQVDGMLGGILSANEVVPLTYNFTLATSSGASAVMGWSLSYELKASGASIGSIVVPGSAVTPTSGSTTLATTNSSPISGGPFSELASLAVFWADSNPLDTLTINVPQSSIDFNSRVPEPGSLELVVFGVAFLGWLLPRYPRLGIRRRRAAKSGRSAPGQVERRHLT
jgi:hypothetical protein